MNINFFGMELSDDDIIRQLTENNHDNKFSIKQKAYYNIIRPVLPIIMRQRLQESVNKKIRFNENFIWEDFVNNFTDTAPNKQESRNGNQKGSIAAEKIPDINKYADKWAGLKYKGENDCAVVLTHDVEEQHGFNFIPDLLEMENGFGLRSSWNIVPYKYKIDEKILRVIRESGHEIGIHGYNHDGKLFYSEKLFNERVPYINEALNKYGAVGFRSPQVHRNLAWLQKLNILYDASCFDYDPFQPFPGGTGSIWPFISGKFVELPYTLPQDHTMFYVLKQKNISIWRNKIDWIAKKKGVILIITHPDYLREKQHLELYKELLIYLKNNKKAWFCTPREMAEWWKKMA